MSSLAGCTLKPFDASLSPWLNAIASFKAKYAGVGVATTWMLAEVAAIQAAVGEGTSTEHLWIDASSQVTLNEVSAVAPVVGYRSSRGDPSDCRRLRV